MDEFNHAAQAHRTDMGAQPVSIPASGSGQPPVPGTPGAPELLHVYGPPRHTEQNLLGVLALVCGLISIVAFGLLTGVPAIILGRKGERACAQGLANNKGIARAGWIMGIVGSVIWALIAGFYAMFFGSIMLLGVILEPAVSAALA